MIFPVNIKNLPITVTMTPTVLTPKAHFTARATADILVMESYAKVGITFQSALFITQ